MQSDPEQESRAADILAAFLDPFSQDIEGNISAYMRAAIDFKKAALKTHFNHFKEKDIFGMQDSLPFEEAVEALVKNWCQDRVEIKRIQIEKQQSTDNLLKYILKNAASPSTRATLLRTAGEELCAETLCALAEGVDLGGRKVELMTPIMERSGLIMASFGVAASAHPALQKARRQVEAAVGHEDRKFGYNVRAIELIRTTIYS